MNLILAILLSLFVNHAKHVHRFFLSMFVTGLFFQRHCSHDSPVDAIFAYTQLKMEDAPRQLRIPKSECPYIYIYIYIYIYGYVCHDINGRTLCQTLKIQWYILNQLCTDTHSQAFCGKDTSRKFCWSLDGNKFRIGNVFLFIENRVNSCRCTWMTLKWYEGSRVWVTCGRNGWNMLILTNQLHFLTTYI